MGSFMKEKNFYIRYFFIGSLFLLLIILGLLKEKENYIEASLRTERLASELLRFHVIANSNLEKDQKIKMQVKEAVIVYLEPLLSEAEEVEEAKRIIQKELKNIEQVAAETLKELSVPYGVSAELGTSFFPIKQYGDILLPPGEYQALKVLLGDANGKNWWCIMFPQLCFVDNTYAVVPKESKEKLQHVLTEEDYRAIVQDNNVEVRFKFFDWLGSLFGE